MSLDENSVDNFIRFDCEETIPEQISKIRNYSTKETGNEIGIGLYFMDKLVAVYLDKYNFAKYLKLRFKKLNINFNTSHINDEALLIISSMKAVYVFSNDTKIANKHARNKLKKCGFEREKYRKMLRAIGHRTYYIKILSDGHNRTSNNDVLEYANNAYCTYFFNKIPLKWIELPEIYPPAPASYKLVFFKNSKVGPDISFSKH